MKLVTAFAGIALGLAVTAAQAEIVVGVTISTTGPAASLGIPENPLLSLTGSPGTTPSAAIIIST